MRVEQVLAVLGGAAPALHGGVEIAVAGAEVFGRGAPEIAGGGEAAGERPGDAMADPVALGHGAGLARGGLREAGIDGDAAEAMLDAVRGDEGGGAAGVHGDRGDGLRRAGGAGPKGEATANAAARALAFWGRLPLPTKWRSRRLLSPPGEAESRSDRVRDRIVELCARTLTRSALRADSASPTGERRCRAVPLFLPG